MRKEVVVDKSSGVAGAWQSYYDELADLFLRMLRPPRRRTILEAGAGKGQLTIPLLRRLPNSTVYIAVDSSRGPYVDWLLGMTRSLDAAGLREKIKVLREDVRRMRGVNSESVDAIVSNELLCDLPREQQLASAFREFKRVLVPGGRMIHGEWSSASPKDKSLFQISHKPSWNPDQLHVQALKAGFREIEVDYFDTTLVFKGEAAEKEVESWGPAKHFLPKNRTFLRKHGLQLPPEHLFSCRKPRK